MDGSGNEWRFHYDEDDFLVAENDAFDETVCHAVSDFLDDLRPFSVDRMIAKWGEIKKHYPQEPVGVAYNATSADLVDGREVIVKSLYGMFDPVRIPESEFSRVIQGYRDFLRAREEGDGKGA
jgi:hypothetical protein